jgi:hypothetical protein
MKADLGFCRALCLGAFLLWSNLLFALFSVSLPRREHRAARAEYECCPRITDCHDIFGHTRKLALSFCLWARAKVNGKTEIDVQRQRDAVLSLK